MAPAGIAVDGRTITRDGVVPLRTGIDVDDQLLARAQAVTGKANRRATIEQALRPAAARVARQKRAIEKLRGIGWEGDPDAIRKGRAPREPQDRCLTLIVDSSCAAWGLPSERPST
jgi:Arc/MetJ family transcription regulator